MSVVLIEKVFLKGDFLCAKMGGGHLGWFVVWDVDLPVLPKPFEFRLLVGRYDRRRMAGVAASSNIIWAILSPSLILNLSWLEFTSRTFISPL